MVTPTTSWPLSLEKQGRHGGIDAAAHGDGHLLHHASCRLSSRLQSFHSTRSGHPLTGSPSGTVRSGCASSYHGRAEHLRGEQGPQPPDAWRQRLQAPFDVALLRVPSRLKRSEPWENSSRAADGGQDMRRLRRWRKSRPNRSSRRSPACRGSGSSPPRPPAPRRC